MKNDGTFKEENKSIEKDWNTACQRAGGAERRRHRRQAAKQGRSPFHG